MPPKRPRLTEITHFFKKTTAAPEDQNETDSCSGPGEDDPEQPQKLQAEMKEFRVGPTSFCCCFE